MKVSLCFLLTTVLLLFMPVHAEAQESLSKSSTWFAKALRNRFPEKIQIHGSEYYSTRIMCSDNDLTKFNAKAGSINIGFGPAFFIEGTLELKSLPSGLKVFNGAKGKKYMLFLQGYLFSPEGRLIWSQKGFPKGNAWVNETGSTISFHLINAQSGSLKGCTAIVLAAGGPILIEGTGETRVILGMKRFSFQDNTVSSSYDPLVSKEVKTSPRQKTTIKSATTSKSKYTNLKYVEKEHNGRGYTEVIGIPESIRKQYFYDLVDYQDRTADYKGAFKVIAERNGLPEKAVKTLSYEGALKNWPMP